MKLGQNKLALLLKLKVEKNAIYIQSLLRKYLARRKLKFLKQRAIKIIKTTERFITLFWFSN
jgi:hypothetical protein